MRFEERKKEETHSRSSSEDDDPLISDLRYRKKRGGELTAR